MGFARIQGNPKEPVGLSHTTLTLKALVLIVASLSCSVGSFAASTGDLEWGSSSSASSEIIEKYLAAIQHQAPAPGGASMEVDIDASIPKLQEKGRLHALRVISRVGRISYRVLGFQGSNTVKSQVIARYLQAEQQGQSNPQLAVTPVNYRFKLKGERTTDEGKRAYVFALVPRNSATGLFKGEIWLDKNTCLPLFERGHFIKNPSIFFKKVDFERAFAIQNGEAVPQHINSVITTRLVGKVQLNVSYSNYARAGDTESAVNSSSSTTLSAQ